MENIPRIMLTFNPFEFARPLKYYRLQSQKNLKKDGVPNEDIDWSKKAKV